MTVLHADVVQIRRPRPADPWRTRTLRVPLPALGRVRWRVVVELTGHREAARADRRVVAADAADRVELHRTEALRSRMGAGF